MAKDKQEKKKTRRSKSIWSDDIEIYIDPMEGKL